MMEWTQEQGTASAALALAKVRAWTRWLTAVERRRMPRFTRRETRRRAGASADGSRRRAGGARHRGRQSSRHTAGQTDAREHPRGAANADHGRPPGDVHG